MTFDNGQQPGNPPQQPGQQGQPQYGQPGQVPPPPPQKKPTGNKRNAWMYIGLGVLFLIIGVMGLLGDDSDAFDWIFVVLGIVNGVMGVLALRKAEPRIDAFGGPQGR